MSTARVELPFWPTSTCNLSWSADHLVAVAGGDNLAILVPRLSNKGPNDLPWDSIIHRINYFTADEAPINDPISFPNWSLGEELSLRHIIALDWSPPGLAAFGTCALAVLHSNHVLTLWHCEGRPEKKDKWTRNLCLTTAVRAFYDASPVASDDDLDTTAKLEAKQVRYRVRAYAWLPPLRKIYSPILPGFDAFVDRGEQLMAVSTEAGDILIMSVKSPFNVLAPDISEWKASVVYRFRLPTETSPADGDQLTSSMTSSAYPPRTFADQLSWSDWDAHSRSQLAYIARGRLYSATVSATYSAIQQVQLYFTGAGEVRLTTEQPVTGPLRFAPHTRSLILFRDDAVICTNLSSTAGTRITSTSHHLDGRWDEISGVGLTPNAGKDVCVNIASLMSCASAETTRLPFSLKGTIGNQSPAWHRALLGTKANFSTYHTLAGAVQERTWGLASSPLGDFVATCASLQPSDSPAHFIAADQKSIVTFTHEAHGKGKSRKSSNPLPSNGGVSSPENISAETLLLSIRHYLGQSEQWQDTVQGRRELIDPLIRTLGLDGFHLDGVEHAHPPAGIKDVTDAGELQQHGDMCLRYIRAQLYYQPNILRERLERLLQIALQREPTHALSRAGYLQLTNIILKLPTDIADGSRLSWQILGAMYMMRGKLTAATGATAPGENDVKQHLKEECSICHATLPFESVKWSRCSNGHQFSRCGLTFLSILQAGASKACGICGVQYLNENAISGMREQTKVKDAEPAAAAAPPDGTLEEQNVDPAWQDAGPVEQEVTPVVEEKMEPRMSLGRLLFAACDRCLLCGGRFVI